MDRIIDVLTYLAIGAFVAIMVYEWAQRFGRFIAQPPREPHQPLKRAAATSASTVTPHDKSNEPRRQQILPPSIWIPQLVAICMLLWALDPGRVWALNPGNPYGYYILLRWVCCAAFAYLAFHAVKLKLEGWVWVLGVTAAIYNPFIPLHLTKEIWSVVNVITIGIAVTSFLVFKSRDAELFEPSALGANGATPRR